MRVRRSKITTNSDRILVGREEDSDEGQKSNVALSKESHRDPLNYISHFDQSSVVQEQGYSVNREPNSFAEASRAAIMNLTNDDGVSFGPTRAKLRWDPKKKNFINKANDNDGSNGEKVKMIKGESGVKIPASMKSGRWRFTILHLPL